MHRPRPPGHPATRDATPTAEPAQEDSRTIADHASAAENSRATVDDSAAGRDLLAQLPLSLR